MGKIEPIIIIVINICVGLFQYFICAQYNEIKRDIRHLKKAESDIKTKQGIFEERMKNLIASFSECKEKHQSEI